MTLRFDSTMLSHSVRVAVVDDDILENDEVFLGSLALTLPDTDVILDPDEAMVTILEDNDGIVTVQI